MFMVIWHTVLENTQNNSVETGQQNVFHNIINIIRTNRGINHTCAWIYQEECFYEMFLRCF